MAICFGSPRKLIQMRTGFWHNLRISSHKIVIICKADNHLPGGGIGRHQHDQVININIICGEGFKDVVQELQFWDIC